MEENKTDPW